MKIELIAPDKVIPYARNPRQNAQAVAKVAASIKEFGFRQPIVVDQDMVIIAGHTRLLASQQLGLAKVPVHIAEGMTPAQIKAYRLADNRVSQEAEWDNELLAIELGELSDLGFALELTGFDDSELDKLLPGELPAALTDEDSVPEVPETPITKPGDVWLLGNHRLLCGDATRLDHVEQVLAGSLADMVFTDPPYNVNYSGSVTDRKRGVNRAIKNDNLGHAFGEFLQDSCTNMLTVCKGAIYICMSTSELNTLKQVFCNGGGHWASFIIWAKNHFSMGHGDYQHQYEPILYGWKEGATHYWCGARNQGDVWFVKRPSSNTLHPTMKPVELIERALENSSKSRDIILDPFGGSGSTMIACEKTGRSARLIELDPKYCDVIVKRWEEFTGKKAVLESDGLEFDR